MPTVTITGENDFARRAELRRLVSDFVTREGDLALERLDGEEADYNRIQEALISLPFLASSKMVVLTSPSKNKQFAEEAETLLRNLPDTTELILYEPKFDKRSGLYKFLKKQTDFREFVTLELPALTRWLVDEATAHGATLGQREARHLIERVGMNQQLLANEAEKLSLTSQPITQAAIDDLTEPTPQSTVFQLLDAALSGRAKQAIGLYDEQRSVKVEPQQIIAMFAWQLHIMALLKSAGTRSADQVAREAKISPYVAGKSQALVRNMTLGRLLQILDELLEIDRRSKRETLDVDAALRVFIISLAQ